jgi:DNA-binding transcriptional LysR family regulator
VETIEPRFEWAMAFLAVAECGSFTRAAERMGCSKAYVSKQVAALERALGAKLLHRTTRRLQPTETGAMYLEYCLRLRETLGEAERAVSNLRTEVRGKVRMSVPTTFGMEFMAELLLALRQAYPALEVELDLSTQQRDLVAEGIDLAVRFTRSLDSRLIAKPLAVLHDWVLGSPAALRRHGTPQHPRDLAQLPCLSNSHFKGDEQWLFMRDGEQAVVDVRHWLRVNNYPLMKRLTLLGDGFAKLPAFLVQREVAAGELVRVLPDHELPSTPVYLVFPDQRPLPRKVRAAVDFVAEWFRRGRCEGF